MTPRRRADTSPLRWKKTRTVATCTSATSVFTIEGDEDAALPYAQDARTNPTTSWRAGSSGSPPSVVVTGTRQAVLSAVIQTRLDEFSRIRCQYATVTGVGDIETALAETRTASTRKASALGGLRLGRIHAAFATPKARRLRRLYQSRPVPPRAWPKSPPTPSSVRVIWRTPASFTTRC